MSQQFELSLTPPILPALCYFIVSILIFFLLYVGKLKVNRLRKYPLFIAYTLFVIAIAAIQINVFANGYEFVRGFLHIDFDPWRYDSVYWGSLIFAMLYLLAMPRNKY
ncbi:TPA: hypothetical protein ACPZ0W_005009 [Enterobacter bugandensis]|jgi:hypothetical protein|uniref:hypothetical protein n=1 Tax=Enterobacter TaxID=547 RepID=UPI0005EC8DBD|nr:MULTISPECIES: hypothetical protein [Enterobacter]MBE3458648.1 hypothetical protein [Enterobacter cloacae complex sp. P21C]MBE4979880.1 hypothetical protein [Enterobacter cloacae complex sp. P3B]KJN23898.1 hypothetical protein SS14_20335 [Enterobacter bugandensis]MBE3497534.1 hypothetical protein [Enterobacter cloacae complex sp. P2B]MBE4870984.1 hypothetical protein [Enterobacter cloacae complex sp. P38RS]